MAHSHVSLPSKSPIRRIATGGTALILLLLVGIAIAIVRSREGDRLGTAALVSQEQLALGTEQRDALYDRAALFETAQPLTAVALTQLRRAGDVVARVRGRAADEMVRAHWE